MYASCYQQSTDAKKDVERVQKVANLENVLGVVKQLLDGDTAGSGSSSQGC